MIQVREITRRSFDTREKIPIRRLMLQGSNGNFPGILSLADLARHREAQLLVA